MARSHGVSFASEVYSSRRPRDDELYVMSKFAKHASRCTRCADPYNVWRRGSELCDQGHSYARDVAKYIYSKGGRPHSVVDKDHYGHRTEVEVPIEYDVIRNLVKAFDKGLNLKARTAHVSHDRHYPVEPRREARVYNDLVAEIASSRRERTRDYHGDRRRTMHFGDAVGSRGSLYYLDEQARRDSRRYEAEPVVILAEPRRSSRYYR